MIHVYDIILQPRSVTDVSKYRGPLVQDGTVSFDGAESSLHFRLLSHELFQTGEVTAGHEIEIEAWAYRQKWWNGSAEIFSSAL